MAMQHYPQSQHMLQGARLTRAAVVYGRHRRTEAAKSECHILSQDSEETPDAEIDAALDFYEKVMQNFPGQLSTTGTALPHAGQASDRAVSQPSMPAGSRPPANTPTMALKVLS